LDVIRTILGTPSAERLAAASVERNLQFVRYLVDPRKAQDQRLVFTLAADGDPQIWQVVLRNSVLVMSPVAARGPLHVGLTRSELADFVAGKGAPAKGAQPLVELDRVLDRTRMLPATTATPAVLDAKGGLKYNEGLQH
jgi:hypothetical protein